MINIIYYLAMWSMEVSIQNPIAIFTSQDNNWTIGRNFYLSQLDVSRGPHNKPSVAPVAAPPTFKRLIFSVSPTKKNVSSRICEPGTWVVVTSEADRVTEGTFLST